MIMDDKRLITAEKLVLAFDGVTAAENVNFSLSRGEYLCVVGENGSGKSTLLRAITGDVKPAGGKLIIHSAITSGGIGYLPQKSKIQRDFPASVREVVLSGCTKKDFFGPFWKKESKEKAERAMELLCVTGIAEKCYGDLSGGQQQRVLLARAICASADLLLLDEPVTGLDPEAAHEMYHTIRKINREIGCAVMMVSHDIGCALREADHVLSMCRGHSFFGTVEEYRRHEKLDDIADEQRHGHSFSKDKLIIPPHSHGDGCGCSHK